MWRHVEEILSEINIGFCIIYDALLNFRNSVAHGQFLNPYAYSESVTHLSIYINPQLCVVRKCIFCKSTHSYTTTIILLLKLSDTDGQVVSRSFVDLFTMSAIQSCLASWLFTTAKRQYWNKSFFSLPFPPYVWFMESGKYKQHILSVITNLRMVHALQLNSLWLTNPDMFLKAYLMKISHGYRCFWLMRF